MPRYSRCQFLGSPQGRFAPRVFKNKLVVVAHYCGCFGSVADPCLGPIDVDFSARRRGASRPPFFKSKLVVVAQYCGFFGSVADPCPGPIDVNFLARRRGASRRGFSKINWSWSPITVVVSVRLLIHASVQSMSISRLAAGALRAPGFQK